MIDYDKLKIAHTIASKIPGGLFICYFYSPDRLEFSFVSIEHEYYGTKNIDDAILKLTELAKPKPKYAVNSVVYALDGFNGIIEVKIVRSYVTGIDETINIYVTDLGASYAESKLYPTREALIEAQVEHWQKVRCQGGGHDYATDSSICIYCDTIQHSQPTATIKGGTLALSEFETVKVRGVERAVSEFDSGHEACPHERDENERLRSLENACGWTILYPCKHCKEYYLCD